MDDILLQVIDLSKSFKRSKGSTVLAVDGVSFSIKRMKTLALVGESGCGKTTIARLLTRLCKPDFGSIVFDGDDIFDLPRQKKRNICKKIQMVFQDPTNSLNPSMNISNTIAEGLRIHSICSRAEEKSKICELLKFVGLNESYMGSFPHQLSGGQKQRVGIARALALEPQLIICDEILSALDVPLQYQIVNLLLEIQRKKRVSYLFISHDLNMVSHFADEVAVMHGGMIVEYGTVEDVCDHPYHPYTRAVLEADSFSNIGDSPTSFSRIESIDGCAYCKHCSIADKECFINKPTKTNISSTHYVLCTKSKFVRPEAQIVN